MYVIYHFVPYIFIVKEEQNESYYPFGIFPRNQQLVYRKLSMKKEVVGKLFIVLFEKIYIHMM